MKYTDLLKQHNIKETEITSASINRQIKELLHIQAAIPVAEKALQGTDLTKAKRKKMEADLAIAHAEVGPLEEKIVEALNKWIPRREEFAKKAEKMAAGRKKTTAQPAAATPVTGPAKPAAAAAPPPPPVKPAAAIPPPAPAKAEPPVPAAGDPPKKKKSYAGWIIGGIILVAGAIVGVNMANKNK